MDPAKPETRALDQASVLGARIRDARKRAGLDQRQLAGAAKVNVRTISQIESGKATTQLDVLIKVAHALGLKLDLAPTASSWRPTPR